MSAQNNQGGGWGILIVALLFLLAINFKPPQDIHFHMARSVGFEVEPSRDIIETEIERAADAFGLRRNVFKALVKVESGGNPRALSHVGARGIAQIMPFNARRCGLRSADKLWDAVLNLRCGAQILSEELEEYGNMHSALTVYNCGRVNCPEGQQYASKVIALSKKMS